MKFTLGGEQFDVTADDVVAAMKQVRGEPIGKRLVEIKAREYPPEQVMAVVTSLGRERFTGKEAEQVLTRLGFVCRRAKKFERNMTSASGPHRDLHGDRLYTPEASSVAGQISVDPGRFGPLA